MTIAVDIDVDWNEEDDTGLPWTFVDRAADPTRIQAGEFVVAGRGTAIAVAEVVDVDETGVSTCDRFPARSPRTVIGWVTAGPHSSATRGGAQ